MVYAKLEDCIFLCIILWLREKKRKEKERKEKKSIFLSVGYEE